MMKSYKVFFTLAMVLVVNQLMAQPGPPPDPDVPITGLEVLIAGGAAYGFRKLINRRKSNPKL